MGTLQNRIMYNYVYYLMSCPEKYFYWQRGDNICHNFGKNGNNNIQIRQMVWLRVVIVSLRNLQTPDYPACCNSIVVIVIIKTSPGH